MTDCPLEEDKLSAFVDGELPPRQQRTVARHLMDCSRCAAQAGQLLAVKSYLGVEPDEQVSLSRAFWQRLKQALDLVDRVAARASRPAVRRPRRTRLAALVAAGVALIAGAWGLRLVNLPPVLQPELLSQAHRSALGRVENSSMSPVAWSTTPTPSAGRTWLPQARADQVLGEDAVTHELYQVGSLTLSAFTLPEVDLDVGTLEPIQVGAENYYLGAYGPTGLVAWQEQGRWQALVAHTSPGHLLNLAELRRSSWPP